MESLTKKERHANMDAEMLDTQHFSTGVCPGCDECGLDKDATDDEIDSANKSYFSWYPCELCGDNLGGDRHPAHAISKLDGSLLHYNICLDCLFDLN